MTAEEMAAIHAACFDRPWSADALARLVAEPGVGTIRGEGGFLIWRVAADEAEILTLAVAPETRRQGLGAALVEAAVLAVGGLGVRRLHLEVAESNHPARALYAQAGFVQTGRRERYYPTPDGGSEAAVLLSLELAGTLP